MLSYLFHESICCGKLHLCAHVHGAARSGDHAQLAWPHPGERHTRQLPWQRHALCDDNSSCVSRCLFSPLFFHYHLCSREFPEAPPPCPMNGDCKNKVWVSEMMLRTRGRPQAHQTWPRISACNATSRTTLDPSLSSWSFGLLLCTMRGIKVVLRGVRLLWACNAVMWVKGWEQSQAHPNPSTLVCVCRS